MTSRNTSLKPGEVPNYAAIVLGNSEEGSVLCCLPTSTLKKAENLLPILKGYEEFQDKEMFITQVEDYSHSLIALHYLLPYDHDDPLLEPYVQEIENSWMV